MAASETWLMEIDYYAVLQSLPVEQRRLVIAQARRLAERLEVNLDDCLDLLAKIGMILAQASKNNGNETSMANFESRKCSENASECPYPLTPVNGG